VIADAVTLRQEDVENVAIALAEVAPRPVELETRFPGIEPPLRVALLKSGRQQSD